ncbi:MAG: hypothetical protein EXR31_03210 [Betaproteobacteria bacterium]|nr:hypothetical protein [Betaproteobacteria bacterium]
MSSAQPAAEIPAAETLAMPGLKARLAAAAKSAVIAIKGVNRARLLRASLVYACVFLAGVIGGGLVTYGILGGLLKDWQAQGARLAAKTAEYAASAAAAKEKLEEAQMLRATAERRLAELHARKPPRPGAGGTSDNVDRGNCALEKGSIAGLKDCIAAFNR